MSNKKRNAPCLILRPGHESVGLDNKAYKELCSAATAKHICRLAQDPEETERVVDADFLAEFVDGDAQKAFLKTLAPGSGIQCISVLIAILVDESGWIRLQNTTCGADAEFFIPLSSNMNSAAATE